jgi:ADP-heptose:LPS heptosyltransferase
VTHETDALLARLAGDGIPVPHPGQAEIDLGLNWNEEVDVDRWLQLLPPDGERQWVAIGPSARTPAGGWPQERLKAAVASLISKHNIWPVVFGGPEAQLAGEAYVQMWQCGYNAAGYLKLRATARALGRCSLYLGNENYVMHLAAAVGVPCVAVFSASDNPGRWYPYGYGHAVLRSEAGCAGCGLKECVEHKNACIRGIETREVITACGQYLEQEVWAAA